MHSRHLASTSIRSLAALSALTTVVVACSGEQNTDDVQQVSGDVNAATAAALTPSASDTLSFQPFTDDVADRAATETRAVIRSARGYQSFFGHAAPATVDFSTEWVIFYSAGTRPTGGFDASVLALLRSGRSLIAITQLVSPGAGCVTTQATTTPYVLIKFPAAAGTSARFFKQDRTQDCDANMCAAVQCATGSSCDPATGKCIADSVHCGGISGKACPGSGKCVDDPSDSCDPKSGGADCGGICSCVENVLCTVNSKFDSSPSVCACVPTIPPTCPPVCDIYCQYGHVLDANGCQTCSCNPPPSSDPCATVRCASGTHCDAGKCVADAVHCGGLAGTPCPGMGKCVDDPSDGCDPKAGGADCGGICTCVQNVLCTVNNKFDSSPGVCACVPMTP